MNVKKVNEIFNNAYTHDEVNNIINQASDVSLAAGNVSNFIEYPNYLNETDYNQTCGAVSNYTTPNIARLYPDYVSTTIVPMEVNKTINTLMKIKDVEILVPNKVVKVTFEDDTFEKAVCHEDDEFSLETAITVCMAKHMLGGSAKYNNILLKGVKLYNNKLKAEEEAKKEQERLEAKWKKQRERKMLRLAKKEEEARNARIQELAEAIRLANEYENNILNDDLGLYNYNEE